MALNVLQNVKDFACYIFMNILCNKRNTTLWWGKKKNAPEGIEVLFALPVAVSSRMDRESQQEALQEICPSESCADQISL